MNIIVIFFTINLTRTISNLIIKILHYISEAIHIACCNKKKRSLRALWMKHFTYGVSFLPSFQRVYLESVSCLETFMSFVHGKIQVEFLMEMEFFNFLWLIWDHYLPLLHFVAFFHVASLFLYRVDNRKVGVDNKKALELTNSTVFHRGRQRKSSRAGKQNNFFIFQPAINKEISPKNATKHPVA